MARRSKGRARRPVIRTKDSGIDITGVGGEHGRVVGRWEVQPGDCLALLRALPDASVDAVVTDPPYDLTAGKKGGSGLASVNLESPYGRARITTGFMGKSWDGTGIAFKLEVWTELLRVSKPGAHVVAFGAPRTYHRMTCAIEDAGWEIRDSLMWLFGSGFPKSLDVSKAIDRAAGAEREVVGTKAGQPGYSLNQCAEPGGVAMEGNVDGSLRNPAAECEVTAPATPDAVRWNGWGTALKPAYEPIVLARKPLGGTVAATVTKHGTGALNIDGCRIDAAGRPHRVIDPKPEANGAVFAGRRDAGTGFDGGSKAVGTTDQGRWPANLVLDERAAQLLDQQAGSHRAGGDVSGREPSAVTATAYGEFAGRVPYQGYGDAGGPSRYFYTAKAGREEREHGLGHRARGRVHDGRAKTNDTPRQRGATERANTHPTVKPLDLMRWLVRLVCPPGGLVLDPFCGSGTTGMAAMLEGMRFLGMEQDPLYCDLAKDRVLAGLELAGRMTPQEAAKTERGQVQLGILEWGR